MNDRYVTLTGNRCSEPALCWYCKEPATRLVTDLSSFDTLLTCDKHELAAFS